MAASPPPQANDGIRFRLRTLLIATAIAAVGAAIGGHFYRLTPVGARDELLALWAAAGAVGCVLTAIHIFAAYRRRVALGPMRFRLCRSQAHSLWSAVAWEYQIPVRLGIVFLFMGAIMFVFGTMWIVQTVGDDRDEVANLIALGTIVGLMFWSPFIGFWKGWRRRQWIELCDRGLLAEGQAIPWASITRCSWHFIHPQRLMISTWFKPYAAEVEANRCEEVEAFLWASCPFDDEQPHPTSAVYEQ